MSIFKSDQVMPSRPEGAISSAQFPNEENFMQAKLPSMRVDKDMSVRSVERPRRGHDI